MPGLIEFGEPAELSLPIADLPIADLPKIDSLNTHFRVYMLSDAHQAMLDHLEQRKDVESGGILVGYPFQTSNKQIKFVLIVGVVPNKSDNRSGVHFTVSPEKAREAREYVEDNYPGMIPVGWYHSHPGLTAFLSRQDMTIVRSIYNAEWNIAWVVDPVRRTEGIFYGPNGTQLVENHRELPLSHPAWISLDIEPECILKIKNEAQKDSNVGTSEEMYSVKHEKPKERITTPLDSKNLHQPAAYLAPSDDSLERRWRKQNENKFKVTVALAVLGIMAVVGIIFLAIPFYTSGHGNPSATPFTKSTVHPVSPPSKLPKQTETPTIIPNPMQAPSITMVPLDVNDATLTLSSDISLTPDLMMATPTPLPTDTPISYP